MVLERVCIAVRGVVEAAGCGGGEEVTDLVLGTLGPSQTSLCSSVITHDESIKFAA
jgi:hypothetical protein